MRRGGTVHVLTDQADLKRISSERGREYDAIKHMAWCNECGAAVSFAGIMHWSDCAGDESDIRFRELTDD